jgi:NhaP-type Na+/H+ or K+/H+ antiporter
MLAFPGVIICTFIFAGMLWGLGFGAHISGWGLLIIGSLLGSTDPIAVAALLKELGTPTKINMLLEGESLLNDGVSLVAAQVFKRFYEGKPMTGLQITWNLVSLCVGGPLFGLIVGLAFYMWMRKIIKDGVLMVSITFIACFLVFFLCEYPPWNLSGILAIVMASIVLSYKSKINIMADDLYHIVETVWKFVQFVGESLLFVITGVFVGRQFFSTFSDPNSGISFIDIIKVIVFFVLMNLGRYLMVLMFMPFYNDPKKKSEYKINWKDCMVIAYAGIRGAFPLIICLTIMQNDSYDSHFKNITSLITIGVIFLGIIFNGLTIKFLIRGLNIIKTNVIGQRIKRSLQKKIYWETNIKYKEVKMKHDLVAANWPMVKDLCGIRNDKKELRIRDSMVIGPGGFGMGGSDRESISFYANTKEVDAEVRIRSVYLLKSLIYSGLQESDCSSQAATMLLEACECALEEPEAKLSVWFHLEDMINNNYVLKMIDLASSWEYARQFLKSQQLVEMSYNYESVYYFIQIVDSILRNKERFLNLPGRNIQIIMVELLDNKSKAEEFLSIMSEKHTGVIQLYQTKRAAKEIVQAKMQTIKHMHEAGVLNDDEYHELLKPCQRQMVKIDSFGFESDVSFVIDIIKSHMLFHELSEEHLKLMSDPRRAVTMEKNSVLFSKGQVSEGLYLLIEGMVKEQFSDETYKTHYMGSLLGISSIINDKQKYDTTVRCESACRLVFVPIESVGKFYSYYDRFELNSYLFYFHHYLQFVKNNFDLLELDNFFSIFRMSRIFKLKKGLTITFERGFFLVKGTMSFPSEKPEDEAAKHSGPSMHLLFDKKPASLLAVDDCVFLVFDQIDLANIVNELRPRMSVGQMINNLEIENSEAKSFVKKHTVPVIHEINEKLL